MRKHLILLTFVSYEAVRLWWWGGNCGVVSFGKTPFFCSIPTLASKSKRFCVKVFPQQRPPTGIKTGTKLVPGVT